MHPFDVSGYGDEAPLAAAQSSPRSRNWRNPITDLMMPNTELLGLLAHTGAAVQQRGRGGNAGDRHATR
jgi:hypothetical protein